MVTTLAVVPARGGSKGVPRKNVRLLAGRPLISWSIEAALGCPAVDRVVVSTDDDEIAHVARQAGAEVPFLRPAALATDEASTESVLLHVVAELGDQLDPSDTVVLLQPTSPIRPPGDLAAALAQYHDVGADSLVSVHEVHPFLWRTAGGWAEPSYDPRSRPRRQDLAPEARTFVENGSMYITSVGALRASGCRISGNVTIFEQSAAAAIDIDTDEDFRMAEAIVAAGASP